MKPKYVKWIAEEKGIVLEDGYPITCYRLDYSLEDDVYDEWALHLRQHYESDDELRESIIETGLSAEEYLRTYVIPQKTDSFGNAARSSDFTEILISDLIQFIHGFNVPRCKQSNRSGKTNSAHGTDILAYKYKHNDKKPCNEDELLAIEVKGGLSSDKFDPIVKAVEDSVKYDEARHAFTLNYYRKKLKKLNKQEESEEIARFQKKSKINYTINYIAAAVVSCKNISNGVIMDIKSEQLELRANNRIFLLHGDTLMDLVHSIYERCIK